MPLPLFLGIGAAIAGAAGIGAGIRGGVKMKDAKDTMECAKGYTLRPSCPFEAFLHFLRRSFGKGQCKDLCRSCQFSFQ